MEDSEVRDVASELVKRIDRSDDESELRELAGELAPVLVAYWDVHPHSAMEMLESSVLRLPLSLSHALVRKVVSGWREKETYDPEAGGSADHCYLSALMLSENFELADRPWVDTVLPYTLDKELKYPRWDRMRDGARREVLVRSIAESSGWQAENG